MYDTLGWVLLAGLPFLSSITIHGNPAAPAPRDPAAPARVAVWSDREGPYQRGDGVRVYLSARRPGHVAVFRIDTDGRVRTLFPREPWGDTYVPRAREFEVSAGRSGRSFMVDDYPGVGYLLAISSERPFDFRDIARGDHWDYRLIEGGRIQGDPYVALADLAARVAPGAEYDYDISPYYVERRYDYPRFVCYDCHAYAKYDEWDPYRQACARFRVVIYDDPRYYPYRAQHGRNVVVARPLRPGPRFVFRDADPTLHYVTHEVGTAQSVRREGEVTGRTSRDVGGRGAVPAPSMSSTRGTPRTEPRTSPPIRAIPSRPTLGDGRPEGRRRTEAPPAEPAPKGLVPADGSRRSEPAVKRRQEPQSTGEPELRRRKP